MSNHFNNGHKSRNDVRTQFTESMENAKLKDLAKLGTSGKEHFQRHTINAKVV
jgi:hypothetical protein